jgi:hypothetical protein
MVCLNTTPPPLVPVRSSDVRVLSSQRQFQVERPPTRTPVQRWITVQVFHSEDPSVVVTEGMRRGKPNWDGGWPPSTLRRDANAIEDSTE